MAMYLINRIPTKVLQNLCPFDVLNGKAPNYSELRIFGCSCYPLLRPYQPHKLVYRSKRCVFLDYSTSQKGYCCLDLETQRVYISRHVLFYETTFLVGDKSQFSEAQSSIPSSGNFYTLSNSILSNNLLPNVLSAEFTSEPISLSQATNSIPIQISENQPDI